MGPRSASRPRPTPPGPLRPGSRSASGRGRAQLLPVPPRRGRGNWRPPGWEAGCPYLQFRAQRTPAGPHAPSPGQAERRKSPPTPERKVAGPAQPSAGPNTGPRLPARRPAEPARGPQFTRGVYLSERKSTSVLLELPSPPQTLRWGQRARPREPPRISFSPQHPCCTLHPTPQPPRTDRKPAAAVGDGALKTPQPVLSQPTTVSGSGLFKKISFAHCLILDFIKTEANTNVRVTFVFKSEFFGNYLFSV